MPAAEQRARDSEHLLLAPRQGSAAVLLALRQAGEGVVDPLDRPGAARLGDEAQMFVHGEGRKHAAPLGNGADARPRDAEGPGAGKGLAGQPHPAAPGWDEAHDGLAERGLAHAVAPDDGERFGRGRQRNAAQHMTGAMEDVQVLDLEERSGRAFPRASW